MKHAVIKSLAAAAILGLGVAACSSSGSHRRAAARHRATGKPLVIDDTPLSPMTDTFNPYSATSTGYVVNADSLYNEPLFIWNILNPSRRRTTILATGYTWSNGGKTLTLTIRSGRQVERRQAVQRQRRRVHLQHDQDAPGPGHRRHPGAGQRHRAERRPRRC